jgi:hypothetical protein
MHSHSASCLRGPVSRKRIAWPAAPCNAAVAEPVPPLTDPAIRADLVRRVRREIAAGTYDTPEKWEAALERLFERLQ